MTLTAYLQILAVYLLGSIAYIIVYVIGIVIALRRWQQHPKVSKWAFIGFTLLLQNSLFGIAFKLWAFQVHEQDMTLIQVEMLEVIYGIVQQILVVIGYAYLIAAIFGYRNNSDTEQAKPES